MPWRTDGFALRGLRVPEAEEVHQRPRVDGPVELRVGADRQHAARQLPRDALLDEAGVRGVTSSYTRRSSSRVCSASSASTGSKV